MTNPRTPIEFWIEPYRYTDVTHIAWVKAIDVGIHVREVLPGRTDTDRLEFLAEKTVNGMFLGCTKNEGEWFIFGKEGYFSSPRAAVDAAMDAEERG